MDGKPWFVVRPLIVRAAQETVLTLRPAEGSGLPLDPQAYAITLYAVGGAWGQTWRGDGVPLEAERGASALRVRHRFGEEGEYVLRIAMRGGVPPAEVRLYALEDDLFDRTPYKGDLHIHTSRSDGREPPAYVAAAARRIGMDFLAITDHWKYEPSLEAIRAFEGVPVDLRLYPGEEIHPPENPVHMVNFGGRFSVNALFQEDEAAYRAEVEAIAGSLEDFPPGVDRYTYASCVWCFRKIREGGGLGILCHPYWFLGPRYNQPEYLTTLLLERQPFDALELIGGYRLDEAESNWLQVARYHEERARGKRIPIVGVSDAHGCERGEFFGWYYTVVFALSSDLPDLIEGIRSLYSVAVEALPGEMARPHGPFRLVRYTRFLLREVFPLHDALCTEEGGWMLAYLMGEAEAEAALRRAHGRTAALYDALWGRGV